MNQFKHYLEAGKFYAFESVVVDFGGAYHFNIGWKTPGRQDIQTIAQNNLLHPDNDINDLPPQIKLKGLLAA